MERRKCGLIITVTLKRSDRGMNLLFGWHYRYSATRGQHSISCVCLISPQPYLTIARVRKKKKKRHLTAFWSCNGWLLSSNIQLLIILIINHSLDQLVSLQIVKNSEKCLLQFSKAQSDIFRCLGLFSELSQTLRNDWNMEQKDESFPLSWSTHRLCSTALLYILWRKHYYIVMTVSYSCIAFIFFCVIS